MEFWQITSFFESQTIPEKIKLISAFLIFGSGIYLGTISPLMFNFFIIPNIEKKLGKKLVFNAFYKNVFVSSWFVYQSDISFYLVKRYLACIFKGERGLPQRENGCALKKAGYTIEMASKFEVFLSLLCVINYVILMIASIVMLFSSKNATSY